MANVRAGYLVIEGCFHCRSRVSFFSEEPVPPIDSYQDGEHFWNHLGSYQASKFDLACRKCGRVQKLDDVQALMLCTRCDPECGVRRAGGPENVEEAWVYAALCANTSHAPGDCVSPEGVRALNEYFNAARRTGGRGIVVVPCSLRRSVDACQGIVLADIGLTEMY